MKTEDFVAASLAQWIRSNFGSIQNIARDSLPMMNVESFFRFISQIPNFPTSEFSIALAGFETNEAPLNETMLKEIVKDVGLTALKDIADDFYTAASWRNNQKNHKRIIALAHAQQPGVHTLNHLPGPSSRDLAKSLLEWVQESMEFNNFIKTGAHKRLLKILETSDKLDDIRSLEILCNFFVKWSDLSIEHKSEAPILALPELGLLADPDLLSDLDSIEDRLEKNIKLSKQIIEEPKSAINTRRKRYNKENDAELKDEKISILNRIEDLRLMPSSQKRGSLTLREIEKLFNPPKDGKKNHSKTIEKT